MDFSSAIVSVPVPPTFMARSRAMYLVMSRSYHAVAWCETGGFFKCADLPARWSSPGLRGTVNLDRKMLECRRRELPSPSRLDQVNLRFLDFRFRRHELRLRQRREAAAKAHQLVERSRLDDVAVVEHQDPGGVAHGREAVRDHEGGTVFHHLVERGLHLRFGRDIERAGGFVE